MIIAHGEGTRRSLSEREALRREAVGSLMREGTGEKEAGATGVAHDDGADPEQTAAQDPDLRAGPFSASSASDMLALVIVALLDSR